MINLPQLWIEWINKSYPWRDPLLRLPSQGVLTRVFHAYGLMDWSIHSTIISIQSMCATSIQEESGYCLPLAMTVRSTKLLDCQDRRRKIPILTWEFCSLGSSSLHHFWGHKLMWLIRNNCCEIMTFEGWWPQIVIKYDNQLMDSWVRLKGSQLTKELNKKVLQH